MTSYQTIVDDGQSEAGGYLSLPGLMHIFAAAALKDEAGPVAETMQAHRITWLVTDFTLAVEAWPRSGQGVTCSTRRSEADHLYFYRDYVLSAGQGTCALGRMAWLLADGQTHRPVPVAKAPASVMAAMALAPLGARQLAVKRLRFRGLGPFTPAGVCRADEATIDFNGHVNHICYANWIEEAVQRHRATLDRPTFLQMSWLREVRLGERVALEVLAEGDRWLAQGKLADGRPCVRAVLAYGPEDPLV